MNKKLFNLALIFAVLLVLWFIVTLRAGADHLHPKARSIIIIVIKPSGSGPGTLRQAPADAQAGGAVTFDPTEKIDWGNA